MNMINSHPVPWEAGTLWERFGSAQDLSISRHELIILVSVKGPTETLGVVLVRPAGRQLDVAEVGAQAEVSPRREDYL